MTLCYWMASFSFFFLRMSNGIHVLEWRPFLPVHVDGQMAFVFMQGMFFFFLWRLSNEIHVLERRLFCCSSSLMTNALSYKVCLVLNYFICPVHTLPLGFTPPKTAHWNLKDSSFRLVCCRDLRCSRTNLSCVSLPSMRPFCFQDLDPRL